MTEERRTRREGAGPEPRDAGGRPGKGLGRDGAPEGWGFDPEAPGYGPGGGAGYGRAGGAAPGDPGAEAGLGHDGTPEAPGLGGGEAGAQYDAPEDAVLRGLGQAGEAEPGGADDPSERRSEGTFGSALGAGRRADDDRTFLEEAGDEIASWMGNEAAERRRAEDLEADLHEPGRDRAHPPQN